MKYTGYGYYESYTEYLLMNISKERKVFTCYNLIIVKGIV